jgi:hypothetical protein
MQCLAIVERYFILNLLALPSTPLQVLPHTYARTHSRYARIRLSRGLLLLDASPTDLISSRSLGELDLESIKVGSVLNVSFVKTI